MQSSNNNRFFRLNNGITIVCERYLYQSGGLPITLHRPKVVNGRQTAETVFKSYREDLSRTGDVVVFVRIVQTSDSSFIEEVSIATNTQSGIGSRDPNYNFDLANYESCAGLIGDAMHAVGRYYESVGRIAAYRLFHSTRARDDLKQMLAAGIDMPIRRSRQLIFAF